MTETGCLGGLRSGRFAELATVTAGVQHMYLSFARVPMCGTVFGGGTLPEWLWLPGNAFARGVPSRPGTLSIARGVVVLGGGGRRRHNKADSGQASGADAQPDRASVSEPWLSLTQAQPGGWGSARPSGPDSAPVGAEMPREGNRQSERTHLFGGFGEDRKPQRRRPDIQAPGRPRRRAAPRRARPAEGETAEGASGTCPFLLQMLSCGARPGRARGRFSQQQAPHFTGVRGRRGAGAGGGGRRRPAGERALRGQGRLQLLDVGALLADLLPQQLLRARDSGSRGRLMGGRTRFFLRHRPCEANHAVP
eukprot:gene25448-biopygen4501